ncbi:hypothetical protein B0H10DRAFT_2206887 [Mycena sp. CBHHK59/15]|nr:hypothetical protein B0H10DRAFT_2206887 [Mycena sp. CBHHK59/15]
MNAESSSEILESYTNKGGIKVIERLFNLPFDYANPSGEKIRVFARSLISKNKAKTFEEEDKLPYFLYLQGGPGFEIEIQSSSGFAAEVHDKNFLY